MDLQSKRSRSVRRKCSMVWRCHSWSKSERLCDRPSCLTKNTTSQQYCWITTNEIETIVSPRNCSFSRTWMFRVQEENPHQVIVAPGAYAAGLAPTTSSLTPLLTITFSADEFALRNDSPLQAFYAVPRMLCKIPFYSQQRFTNGCCNPR